MTFGADVVFYGYLLWHVGTQRPSRYTSWPTGPFLLVLFGALLSLLDATRHILLDHGGVICEPSILAMYSGGHLSAVGQFCRCTTILGMTLIVSGVLWFSGIPWKVTARIAGVESV